MDTVRLSNITLQATHGCYDHEKLTPQTFIVDVECLLNKALDTSDELSKTLNYEDVRTIVFDTFSQRPVNLIETLAVEMAEKIVRLELVKSVKVRIAKPDIWKDALPSVDVMRGK